MALTATYRKVYNRLLEYPVKVFRDIAVSNSPEVQAVALVDSTGAMVTSFGTSPASSVGDGSKDVTVAGAAEPLAASTACLEVEIVAKSTNTGNIWVGGSGVAANSGRPLLPLQSLVAKVSNLNLIYLDADTNGEGVTYIYYS